MTFKLLFKYGTIYREVLHLNLVDWCQITNKAVNTVLIKFILDVAIDSAPDVIHECPYRVIFISAVVDHLRLTINHFQDVMMINATFKTSKATTIFPRGDYKMHFIFLDGNNETIVDFASVGSVISSYIETFG